MAEALFYHLEHFALERVLPNLLERTLERGWRAVVRAGSKERLDALDMHLWTYRDDSFLPHGSARDAEAARHPVVLTLETENPNQAAVLFLVDGVPFESADGYERVVYLFDGRDEEAVRAARDAWKSANAGDFDVTYWQQSTSGKFTKKA